MGYKLLVILSIGGMIVPAIAQSPADKTTDKARDAQESRTLLRAEATPPGDTAANTPDPAPAAILPPASRILLGFLGGVARNSATGQPVPQAKITVHSVDKGTDRTAVSGGDGAFAVADLEPGRYEITAIKDGFEKSSANIQVAPLATDRIDLALAAVAATVVPPAQTGNSALPPAAATPAAAAPPAGQNAVASAASAAAPTPQPEAPAAAPAVDLQTPFADHDWTWLNGNPRTHDSPLDSKYFTGEFRADTFYGVDFNQPKDHSMGGSSEVFRSGEVQLEQISLGGDLHVGNVRGRLLTLFGMFSTTTPRNDASAGVGQWDVRNAYRYLAEAYGGYHFNVNHGLNVDAGIFVSYVGLFSYYNFDNWAYQPSYVSSNTPWFFNGVRVQWFPTNHLKIEPWFINGWQSYNKFNGHPGLGGQIKWTPKPWLNIISNEYAVGNDNIGLAHRGRYHTDNSIEIKYYDHPKPGNGINRMALTFTGDAGCETGDGVTCHGGDGPYNPLTGKGGPKQSFLGYMLYNRWWWHKDVFAFTLGGGQINNPGRYLVLVLPVNGADAVSGTPYFPSYPGAPFKAYDGTATLDWMPTQFFTFRSEFGYRHANVPYWSGRQGITPPGGNNGFPAQYVCNDGAPSPAPTGCGQDGGLWTPDLRRGQALLNFAILVKF